MALTKMDRTRRFSVWCFFSFLYRIIYISHSRTTRMAIPFDSIQLGICICVYGNGISNIFIHFYYYSITAMYGERTCQYSISLDRRRRRHHHIYWIDNLKKNVRKRIQKKRRQEKNPSELPAQKSIVMKTTNDRIDSIRMMMKMTTMMMCVYACL